ncbi:L-amino acid N-acyltransferase YncA [Aliiruegeria haliotis]|uniref:L-amino acid N-acyltransferase YncA n=1 Tax=Aliiruegeria haliotis TaxID=1280846 RepID=A0A2T0RJR8_9RHOB|nr:GNAT family N-acetyltransferase [Aliiruegeria haliotis]PRY21435.1 L-amino acid N-acyltransferase YncA [Aliiruegeria haliotis]
MSAESTNLRAARPEDADGISRLVITTLYRSNAKDYPPEVLARVAEVNAPQRVLDAMRERSVWVAVAADGEIVGTAGVCGDVLKSLFVHPKEQGRGLGRLLLGKAMDAARGAGLSEMRLQSSLTALGFYPAAGFEDLAEIAEGDDRTVLMRRSLRPPIPA